jgi:hypothetical protein
MGQQQVYDTGEFTLEAVTVMSPVIWPQPEMEQVNCFSPVAPVL